MVWSVALTSDETLGDTSMTTSAGTLSLCAHHCRDLPLFSVSAGRFWPRGLAGIVPSIMPVAS
jgi:hypothetical protein